jgi:hypothetical protein
MNAAWGKATEIDTKPMWFNPNTGWRARYDASLGVVQLSEYMPLMSLLGPGDKIALPLIGLTPDQLAKVYPKMAVTTAGASVQLPPTEFATALTMIGLQFDPQTGKTATAVFALPFDTLAHKDLLGKGPGEARSWPARADVPVDEDPRAGARRSDRRAARSAALTRPTGRFAPGMLS